MAPLGYRILLRLLPSAFRREYGREMCEVVEEQWRAVRRGAGSMGAVTFWLRQGWAVIRAAVSVRRGSWEWSPGPAHDGARGVDDDGRSATMDGIWLDARQAARSLWKRPLFTLLTVATLALGIGASTALFSAVYTVLYRDLPYEAPDRVVAVFHEDRETGERGDGLSPANARDLMERTARLGPVAIADPWSMDLQVDGRAESLRGWMVSEGFFEAVGAEALLGRTFLPSEYVDGGEAVVLLGYGTWIGRFGGDPDVVGRDIRLDGQAVRVVGVLAPGFRLPGSAELWLPRPPQEHDEPARSADYTSGFARLAPGATLSQAQAEVESVGAALSETYPRTNATTGFRLVPLREHLFGDVRTPLLVLLGAVGFVLLIACANVAGLMLARGAERQREYALRGALGADAGRLVRHVGMESFILAGLGCILGIGLTYGGIAAIQTLGPDHLPRIDELRVDGRVLAFAAVAAVLSALLSGLAPSLRLSRPDLADLLSGGGRTSTGSRRAFALRNRLVVAEIAAAVVLLVGAGLLFRSFAVLLDKELGFDAGNKLAVQVFAYDYEDGGAQVRFVDQAVENMEAIPGVRGVALTSSIPSATDGTLASIDVDLPFVIQDRAPPPEGQEPRGFSILVSPGYFDLMGMPLVEGRGFLPTDDATSPRVAVVNETFARRHFPQGDAPGRSIVVGTGERARDWEIVGVVGDVRPMGYESEPRPEIYRSLRQAGTGSLTFVLDVATDAGSVTAPAMEAIWAANPSQSVWGASTIDALLADWLKERRFNLLILGGFSLIALALAAVGVYGLVSFSVEQRVAELGIRKALGGQPGTILGMVLREGAVLAGTGVALGVVGALVLSRFLRGMLFGIEPTDPATFLVLAVSVLGVAGVAALVPALRAVRVDPVVALRRE